MNDPEDKEKAVKFCDKILEEYRKTLGKRNSVEKRAKEYYAGTLIDNILESAEAGDAPFSEVSHPLLAFCWMLNVQFNPKWDLKQYVKKASEGGNFLINNSSIACMMLPCSKFKKLNAIYCKKRSAGFPLCFPYVSYIDMQTALLYDICLDLQRIIANEKP